MLSIAYLVVIAMFFSAIHARKRVSPSGVEMGQNESKYRAYWLEGTGKSLSVDWIEAVNDDQAVATARTNIHSLKCEVWDGRRLVRKIDAEQPRALARAS
jgi:hypothetical protein